MKKIPVGQDIKALIFDCDGTLVDSMPLHMKAWEESFKKFNTAYNEKFLFSLKGMKETDIVNYYNEVFSTKLIPDEVVKAKHNVFKKLLRSVKPIEPVAQLARQYYGKLPLAVVSGSVKEIVHEELKITGLYDLFKVILTADDPYKPKPSPDAFFAAAEILGVKPEICMVLEDGDAGLQAAREAGMTPLDVRSFI